MTFLIIYTNEIGNFKNNYPRKYKISTTIKNKQSFTWNKQIREYKYYKSVFLEIEDLKKKKKISTLQIYGAHVLIYLK